MYCSQSKSSELVDWLGTVRALDHSFWIDSCWRRSSRDEVLWIFRFSSWLGLKSLRRRLGPIRLCKSVFSTCCKVLVESESNIDNGDNKNDEEISTVAECAGVWTGLVETKG